MTKCMICPNELPDDVPCPECEWDASDDCPKCQGTGVDPNGEGYCSRECEERDHGSLTDSERNASMFR